MKADDFGLFDIVKMKASLDCEDVYGEQAYLPKGKTGCVLENGEAPNTLIVEFRTGRGMKSTDYTTVELDPNCLQLADKIGQRFSELPSYSATARALRTGSLK